MKCQTPWIKKNTANTKTVTRIVKRSCNTVSEALESHSALCPVVQRSPLNLIVMFIRSNERSCCFDLTPACSSHDWIKVKSYWRIIVHQVLTWHNFSYWNESLYRVTAQDSSTQINCSKCCVKSNKLSLLINLINTTLSTKQILWAIMRLRKKWVWLPTHYCFGTG